MTTPVTRAGAVATIGGLTILAPVMGRGTVVLFAGIAVLALVVPRERALFDVLAAPEDYESGRLNRLAGFALAVTALAILATVEAFGLPVSILTMTVLILVGGNLGEALARERGVDELPAIVAFCVAGTVAGIAGFAVLEGPIPNTTQLTLTVATFLAVTGALIAALCRTDLYRRDDPVVLLSVGLVLWLFSALSVDPSFELVASGILVTVALGYVAYVTETASIAGMLTGVILGFVTIVLAGFHWFAALFAFFAIGGLATKYRYAEKAARGVAEKDQGARGTGNVLGNSLVALVAVVGYASAPEVSGLDGLVMAIAFGGAVGTALADTLSSEIGSLYDGTRLITTFERVDPGTNGGITLQGGVAGVAGALVVGGICLGLFQDIEPGGGIVIAAGALVGMTADSLFGATIEERFVGNQTVNLLATAVGAMSAIVAGVYVGVI